MSDHWKASEFVHFLSDLEKLKSEFDSPEEYDEVVELLMENPEFGRLLFPTKTGKPTAQNHCFQAH